MYPTGANVCYLLDLENRTQLVAAALGVLTPKKDEFDAIAFSGLSGSVMSSILATKLDKYLIGVRKTGEPTYSASRYVEHYLPGVADASLLKNVRWIMCDDAISSGNTARDIWTKMRTAGFSDPVAALLYRTAESTIKAYGNPLLAVTANLPDGTPMAANIKKWGIPVMPTLR